ncbi:13547_t:CDS:2 [Ambispora leptoticha]|uniref:13547_t:CDS:1 n=1 Tax=Ambispora leptoticha TaxID=144679 RepID=A0A9N8Z4H3_9GLOM|nr:13547_t:CDS:2 [Ambispora leptoticha]
MSQMPEADGSDDYYEPMTVDDENDESPQGGDKVVDQDFFNDFSDDFDDEDLK